MIAFIPISSEEQAENSKYIQLFCGKPLIFWCLDSLEKSNDVSAIYISTDNEHIKLIIAKFGFEKICFIPNHLGNDFEQSIFSLLHTINFSNNENIIALPTASPFLQLLDLEKVISEFREKDLSSMLSVVEVKQPEWSEYKSQFVENSVFYLSKMSVMLSSKRVVSGIMDTYKMPEYTLNSYEKEWEVAELLMKKYLLAKTKNPKNIRLFATDVDGVLTDAGMYYSESGDELKKFNTHDGMGLVILQKAGIKTAIITSENTKMVENRAKKLKVDYLYQGKKYGGKLSAILEMCEKENITLENVAYIGDDVNCFDALSNVGLAACPADAEPEILNIPNILKMTKKGGEGCVREFSRIILVANE